MDEEEGIGDGLGMLLVRGPLISGRNKSILIYEEHFVIFFGCRLESFLYY